MSTSGSASTTGSTTSPPRSASVSSEKLDEILELRTQVAARYRELLGGIDGVELPCADDVDHVRSWFVYVVKLPDNATRERVIAHFERERIGYNRYLPSIHLQPYMRERYGFREGMCPVSEDASSRTLALPFFTGARARGAGARRRGPCRRRRLKVPRTFNREGFPLRGSARRPSRRALEVSATAWSCARGGALRASPLAGPASA